MRMDNDGHHRGPFASIIVHSNTGTGPRTVRSQNGKYSGITTIATIQTRMLSGVPTLR
jgi:hypothetical protein